MKFKENDRINFSGIVGTVVYSFESNMYRLGWYEVILDGHVADKDGVSRPNRFTEDFFDAYAEPYVEPKPTAEGFFDTLVPGDRFTARAASGETLWAGAEYITYIGTSSFDSASPHGAMISGIRRSYDVTPVDLWFRNDDTLTKVD